MNSKIIEAVYEQGVLRPLQKLDLPEHKRVKLTISDAVHTTTLAADSCYDLAVKADLIGCLKDAPNDLSTNPKHLEGFGES